MEVAVKIEGSSNDETGHDEREWDVAVLFGTVRVRSVPKVIVLFGGDGEFLLKWHPVGGILEDVERVPATSESGVTVQPLVMDSTQLTVTAIDSGNDKELMSLSHGGQRV